MIKNLNLNHHEQEALEHAHRYRMLLPELVPDGLSVVDRLGHRKIIAKAPLFRDRDYYYLTARARRFLATPHFRPGPLSEADKIRDFAMICLCFFDHNTKRTRLMSVDFDSCFTEQHLQRLDRYYLHERPGQPDRVGYLRVDRSGRGRWDRLVSRVHRDILRHDQDPLYRQLMDDGLLEFAVVTATEEKASRLEHAFQEHSLSASVPVHVHVVPELLLLIAPPPVDAQLGNPIPHQRV